MAGGADKVGRAVNEVHLAVSRRDIGALLGALEDPATEVRLAAVEGLGIAGGSRARVALLSVARRRPDERPDVRVAALRSLGRVMEKEEYAALLSEFIAWDSRRVVAEARRLLSAADPEGYPSWLAKRGCLDHSAVNVYGRSRESSAVGLLSGFLSERMAAGDITSAAFWGRVYAAVRALGKIGGEEAMETLRSLLSLVEGERGAGEGFLAGERAEKILEAAREGLRRSGSG